MLRLTIILSQFLLLASCLGEPAPTEEAERTHSETVNDAIPVSLPNWITKNNSLSDEHWQLTEGLHYRRIKVQPSNELSDRHYYHLTLGIFLSGALAQQAIQTCQFPTNASLPQVNIVPVTMAGEHYVDAQFGRFATQQAASDLAAHLSTDACDFRVSHSSYQHGQADSPYQINLLVLDPAKYRGKVFSKFANNLVTGLGKLSEASAVSQSIAAVNGGFFVMQPEDGYVGEAAGVAAVNGQLESEPTEGRPALIVRGTSPVEFSVSEALFNASRLKTSDGQSVEVDGFNRPVGVIRNCGRGNSPVHTDASHDQTCIEPDDLVVVTAELSTGINDNRADYVDIRVITTENNVEDTVQVGATGSRRIDLDKLIKSGQPITLEQKLVDEAGQEIELTPDTYILNGGPLLIEDGTPVTPEWKTAWQIDQETERERLTFNYNWLVKRNPRTAAAILKDGRVVLLTVDGRQAGISAGLSIEELRSVFMSMGASSAINLDGGGSTGMTIGAELVTSPSDKSGEREVGDVLIFESAKR